LSKEYLWIGQGKLFDLVLFSEEEALKTDQLQWKAVFGTLAEKFTLARLALNSLI